MLVDGNGNRVSVEETEIRDVEGGRPLLVIRLIDDPSSGYICAQSEGAMFGDESSPDSWGMTCQAWFGVGERFPDAETALKFYSDLAELAAARRNGDPERAQALSEVVGRERYMAAHQALEALCPPEQPIARRERTPELPSSIVE